jgi:RNA polymerase sigma factor (sigma-70 family)
MQISNCFDADPVRPTPFASERDNVAALYAEHHGWLRSWLCYRLSAGGKDIADDLAHDTFLRVLAGRCGCACEPILQPRAYLTTVAKGVVVSWLRRQTLERAWLDALAAMPERQHPSPERQSIILETLHEIDAMLDTVKPLAKQAFLMATVDGMKQQDIAHALKVTVPTVKSYIRKAFLACLSLMPCE